MFNLFNKGLEKNEKKVEKSVTRPLIELVQERDTLISELSDDQTKLNMKIELLQLAGRSAEQKALISKEIGSLRQVIDQKNFKLDKRIKEIKRRGGEVTDETISKKTFTEEEVGDIFEKQASSRSVETGS